MTLFSSWVTLLTLGGPLVNVSYFSGTVDLQGCFSRFLSGGVGLPGPSSAKIVHGCDVGELQEPGLPG